MSRRQSGFTEARRAGSRGPGETFDRFDRRFVMDVPFWLWAAVIGVIVVMLAVDLFAHRNAHVIRVREAAAWSGV